MIDGAGSAQEHWWRYRVEADSGNRFIELIWGRVQMYRNHEASGAILTIVTNAPHLTNGRIGTSADYPQQ
jgi:hypothetical protein